MKFSIKHLLAEGWKLTKTYFGLIIVATIATTVLAGGIADGSSYHASTPLTPHLILAATFLIIPITILLGFAVQFAYINLYLRLSRGNTLSLGEIFPDFATFWKYVGASLLVSIITCAGLIVFIVPGIYFGLRFCFASLLVIDKKIGPIEALKQSSRLTRGIKWKLLLFWLVLIGINILGAIPIFVGLLVTIPMSYFAWVRLYHELHGERVTA